MADLTTALADDDLLALRKGYQPAAMLAAATGTLGRLHEAGRPWIGAIGAAQYEGGPLSPKDRERCLVALLAARSERLTLAVHLYWGLMEGLTAAELAHTLMLVGIYDGVPAYTAGLLVLQATVGQLQAAVAAGETSSPAVLQRLVSALR